MQNIIHFYIRNTVESVRGHTMMQHSSIFSFDALGYKGCVTDENELITIDSVTSGCDSVQTSADILDFDDQDIDDVKSLPNNRNERHKLVERQRRDKTRAILRELQSAVSGTSDAKQTPNINTILEETLEFLQSENDAKKKKEIQKLLSMKVRDVGDIKKIGIMSPFDDTSCRRYLFAFDYAPMGLVISSVDGRVLGANKSFLNWFKFDKGMEGSTIFSLTCPPDLSQTLKVSRLLNRNGRCRNGRRG